MRTQCNGCGCELEVSENKLLSTETILCDDCMESEARERYKDEVRWHENMNNCYKYDDGGFCDGFTQY